MKNLLFKDFGTFLNTEKGEQYEINKVIIFKDNQVKMIANYFLDNFSNYQFEINGDVNRKLKIDLSSNQNFVVKSEEQHSWNDRTQYTLYINGVLNNYVFDKLELIGERLEAKYILNGCNCSQCIGWNQKESNKLNYHTFKDALAKINTYSIDSEQTGENIKELLKVWKQYKKAKEIEKTYTANDYLKMSLSSGTTEEENKTILKNNGYEV